MKNKKTAREESVSAWGICAVIFSMLLFSSAVKAEMTGSDSGSNTNQYLLGPQDELEISVWKEDDLNKTVVVRPDGAINFPLAGEIFVAKKTVGQVQKEISRKIKNYIPEAVVTVSVAKVAGYRVYVLGKVNNPGEYILGSYVDVMQALTLADGFTPYASENDVKILRRQSGKKLMIEFDYSEVIRGKNLDQNITLLSGDIVVVP